MSRATLVNLDYEDNWDAFIEACEQLQAQHDSGNCPDECMFCEEQEQWGNKPQT